MDCTDKKEETEVTGKNDIVFVFVFAAVVTVPFKSQKIMKKTFFLAEYFCLI